MCSIKVIENKYEVNNFSPFYGNCYLIILYFSFTICLQKYPRNECGIRVVSVCGIHR